MVKMAQASIEIVNEQGDDIDLLFNGKAVVVAKDQALIL